MNLARKLKKIVEYESNGDTNCNSITWSGFQVLEKGLEEFEIGGRIETIQTTALLRSARNTEKSSGDLRRFAVPQPLVKDSQLRLVLKTCKE